MKTKLLNNDIFQYVSIFEHFDDFIAIINIEDRTIAYINDAVVDLFELTSRDDLLGKKIPNLRKNSLTNEKVDQIFDIVLTGEQYVEEVEYKTRNEREFWGLLKVMKITIQDKEFILYKITDITKIKQIEIENKLNNQRLRFAIEGNGDGLWEWNLQSNRTFFSKRWKAMLGYEDIEVANNFESWKALLHPEDLFNILDKVDHYLNNFKQEQYDVEFRMLCKNGQYKWINARGMVVKTDIFDNPISFVGTHSDIDKLKNVQQDLEIYSARLEKSNADIKQFAYITTHDLKEPLRTISNNIQLLKLKNKGLLDVNSLQLIDYSVDGCKKLMGIIKELLDYAQLDIGDEDREFVDLNTITRNVVGNLELYIKSKNTTIELNQLPEDFFGNKLHLSRLFQNLITNAIKYNDKEKPKIIIDSVIKENKYIISVKDNGMGISADFDTKIYEIFKRLKTEADSESVGMGLAVCKKIVEAHKGNLWHESKLGEGTTFFFSLPYELY